MLIFGGASLAAAYAGSSNQLIAWRAVMGIGGAIIMPATLSIIIDVFPRDGRGRAIAIWSAVAGLGIGLGPLLGGVLLEHFWWGSVFLINVPVVALSMTLGRCFVPESRDPHPVPIDYAGAVFFDGRDYLARLRRDRSSGQGLARSAGAQRLRAGGSVRHSLCRLGAAGVAPDARPRPVP